MKILYQLADKLFKHQKKLEIVAILLLCFSISFRIDNQQTKWFWNDYSFVAVFLAAGVILIALIWIRIEKMKTNELINAIRIEQSAGKNHIENRVDELSVRQKVVFDLILSGKSNKEILNELSIEQSTLKTHINKIYKILKIDSRKQIRQFKNEAEK
jgi:DNA-binding CsgD family transcriptional regulator